MTRLGTFHFSHSWSLTSTPTSSNFVDVHHPPVRQGEFFHCHFRSAASDTSSLLQLTPARRPGSRLPPSLLAGLPTAGPKRHTLLQGNEAPQSTYELPLQLAKADRSLGVEMKPSLVGEKRLERNFPELPLSLSELRHVPCVSEARSEASTPVYYSPLISYIAYQGGIWKIFAIAIFFIKGFT